MPLLASTTPKYPSTLSSIKITKNALTKSLTKTTHHPSILLTTTRVNYPSSPHYAGTKYHTSNGALFSRRKKRRSRRIHREEEDDDEFGEGSFEYAGTHRMSMRDLNDPRAMNNQYYDNNPYQEDANWASRGRQRVASPRFAKRKQSFSSSQRNPSSSINPGGANYGTDETFLDDYDIQEVYAQPSSRGRARQPRNTDDNPSYFLDTIVEGVDVEQDIIDDFQVSMEDLKYGARTKVLNSDKRVFKKMIQDLIQTEEYRVRTLKMGLSQEEILPSFQEFAKYFIEELLPLRKVQDTINRCRKPRELLFKLYSDFIEVEYASSVSSQERFAALAHMTDPHLWYHGARNMPRKIIMHVGPTNSGKTHNAFKRLMEAKSGYYLAPLRLLASEGYLRMKDAGIKCSLVTGDYKIIDEDATHQASTVEMCDTEKEVEVVVLDEIQMIGNDDRGWAWTRALLGVRAHEIHLCGEERSVELVKELCKLTGDEVTVNSYERLTELQVDDEHLGTDFFSKLQKGDCIVAFSRRELYALKNKIEQKTKFKVAVVYGGLPPETRVAQAQKFNRSQDATPQKDEDGNELESAEILVATDAIGYGLNLNIRRVIFHKTEKFDGTEQRALNITETRQIGGRAGRFSSEWDKGHVVGLKKGDVAHIRQAFQQDMPVMETAGLLPTQEQLYRFNMELGHEVPFHTALMVFQALSKTDSLYHVCSLDDQIAIAKIIRDAPLSFPERYVFSMAPFPTDDPVAQKVLQQYADFHANGGPVPPIVELPKHPKTVEQLQQLETTYKVLEAYNWLSYQFETFSAQEQVNLMQERARAMIEDVLQDPEIYANYLKQQKQRRAYQQQRFREDREMEQQLVESIKRQRGRGGRQRFQRNTSYLEEFF